MQRNTISRITTAFLALMLILGASLMTSHFARAASNLYVDATNGDDSNDCLSEANACATIQAAINKAAAGDTINVAAGEYETATTIVIQSGT